MKLNLGPLLKRRRMKQAALAEILDVSPGYISGLVSGQKEPSFETLRKIQSALNASPAELFGMNEQEPEADGFAEDDAVFAPAKANPKTSRIDPPKGNPPLRFQVLKMLKNQIAFGLLRNDELTIDMASKSAFGKIAVVTRVDLSTGVAQTLVRRIEKSAVFSDDPTHRSEGWSSDTHNYGVIGDIVKVTRHL